MTTDLEVQQPDQTRVLAAVAETARLAQIQQSGLLDLDSDPTFDRFARLAAALVGAPVSFVSLVGIDGQFTPGMVRLDDPTDDRRFMATEDSFCQYAVSTGEPLIIEDARTDVLVRDTPLARTGEVQAYAGIPLRTHEGNLLGTLCVLDRKPRTWQEHELSLLRDLTVTVQQEIEHRLNAGRILGARGLARQMAEQVDRLTDAARALIQEAEQRDDARLQRYSATAASRLDSVRKLARDLRAVAVDHVDTPITRAPTSVDLRQAVDRSVASVRTATRTSALQLGPVPPFPLPVRCDPLVLESAVTHVLISALHRSSAEGTVHLDLDATSSVPWAPDAPAVTDVAVLTVRAPGCHLPATELARVVSRLHEATTGEAHSPGGATTAALRMAAGALTAQSGPVRGTSSAQGTTVTVEWPLHRDSRAAALAS